MEKSICSFFQFLDRYGEFPLFALPNRYLFTDRTYDMHIS